jgi:MurNAc alpha-1-phosphate uridylyltransferase
MSSMKTAMILAAGRGERLRPLTDTQPKALCVVGGKPIIEHHIINLVRAGFKTIVINHAYLGGKIRQQLGNGERWNTRIIYSPEPPGGLETGGGIVNALRLLGDEPFITVNADIVTDYDYSKLTLPKGKQAHLVLVNTPSHRAYSDFGLSSQGSVENANKNHLFSGIACYHPTLFCTLKPGRFSITPMLKQLASNGQLSGELHTGQWIDIGSPEQLMLAESWLGLGPTMTYR